MSRALAAILVGSILLVAVPVGADPVPSPATVYDQALAALLSGDLDDAEAGFARVATSDPDPGRRAAAAAMLDLVRRMRAGRLTVAPAMEPVVPSPEPSPSPSPSPSSESSPSPPPAASGDGDSGRVSFIVWTTLASVYSSVVFLDVADVDDFRVGTLAVTGITGLGFATSLYATGESTPSTGTADFFSIGLLAGLGNGLLLASPLDLDGTESVLGLSWAAMAVGGLGGALYGSVSDATAAQASLTGSLALGGLATAGLGLGLSQPDVSEDTVLVTLLVGLDVGAAAGLLLTRDVDWSVGRARLVGLSGFLGGLVGASAAAIGVGVPNGDAQVRLLSGATLVGMWAGAGLGAHLTRGMKPGRGSSSALLLPAVTPDGATLTYAGSF